MKTNFLKNLMVTTALSLLLTGCGGGGGAAGGHNVNMNGGGLGNGTNTGSNTGNTGSNTNTGSNNNSNSSTLTPVSMSTFTASSEYNRTSSYGGTTGLAQVNAATAFAQGASGLGIVVGVIDTGIDLTNNEFAGAISNKSINIVNNSKTDMLDVNPHGTWVAGVIGARMNGNYTMGMAYNSTILAVKADTVDSLCPTGCFLAGDLAKGVTYAADNGARVINMSLGTQGYLGDLLTNAMKHAVTKNALLVVAAGNAGLSEVDAPANLGATAGIAGNLIAVGAVDENNVITSFSNRAGAAKNYYLVAPGEHILTTDTNNSMALTAGTSFAAPMVSGAAALLMQATPYLTSQQVATILLNTATDLGAAGVDDVYGHGLLNVGAALAPVGPSSVPTGTTAQQGGASTATTQIALSSAFGDALSHNSTLQRGIMVDSFGRAYGLDMSKRVSSADFNSGMSSFIASRNNITASAFQFGAKSFVTASFTDNSEAHKIVDQRDPAKLNGDTRLSLSTQATDSVGVTYTHGHNLGQAFGLTEVSNRAASDTAKADMFDNAFLGLVDGGNALVNRIDIAKGLALNFGGGMEDGKASFTSDNNGTASRNAYAAELAYSHKGFKLGLQAGQVNETKSALASESDGALAFGAASRTSFVGLNASIPLMDGLTLAGTYQVGMTQIDNSTGSMLGDFKNVRSDKFALALMADNVARKGDRLTVSFSSPLRVNSGTANLTVPVGVDSNGAIIKASQRVNLAPSGRQMDLGVGYNMALTEKESLGFSTVGTLNPGNDASATAAVAVGVRYTKQFN